MCCRQYPSFYKKNQGNFIKVKKLNIKIIKVISCIFHIFKSSNQKINTARVSIPAFHFTIHSYGKRKFGKLVTLPGSNGKKNKRIGKKYVYL